jgi:hypothetical protein
MQGCSMLVSFNAPQFSASLLMPSLQFEHAQRVAHIHIDPHVVIRICCCLQTLENRDTPLIQRWSNPLKVRLRFSR